MLWLCGAITDFGKLRCDFAASGDNLVTEVGLNFKGGQSRAGLALVLCVACHCACSAVACVSEWTRLQ